MKIKYDFVTNSSSASFIVYVQSDISDLEYFRKSMRELMDKFISSELPYIDYYKDTKERIIGEIDDFLNTIGQLTPNTYKMDSFTSMLNSILQDTPSYIKWLVLEGMTFGFHDYGITNITLRIED